MGRNGAIQLLDGTDVKAVFTDGYPLKRMALGMVPFAPVPFSGKDLYVALARIGIYGVAAYFTYPKSKNLSYIFMTAAGTSLATSVMSGVWGKQ